MIYLITIEPADNRYTTQWKRWIPSYFIENRLDVIEIDGSAVKKIPSNNKNFLSVNLTNKWKSEQIRKLSLLFEEGKIKKRDKFLFYDAWHYGIIALRYMSELNKIPIKIFGMWHAGSYDKYDLLGQLNITGFRYFEASLLNCLDKSFVATHFHKKLIIQTFQNMIDSDKIIVTGFPYNFSELDRYKNKKKENLIVFPHRISIEKQPAIIRIIQKNYKVIICQDMSLTKHQYHSILAKSKIVFSASLQETWGIGIFEGMYLGAVPCIPDRLSYTEMYFDFFKYPSKWTEDFVAFRKYQEILLQRLQYLFNLYDNINLEENMDYIKQTYCTFTNIFNEVVCDV